MNLRDKIKSTLLRFGSSIAAEIKEELKQQGHVNTGELSNSILFGVSENGNDMNMDISMLDYHVFVEKGVKANRIPFGGKRTGRKRSLYIDGLIKFFKNKRLSEKEATRASFATARKHSEKRGPGMPTFKSYKDHSKNGRRLLFIEESTKASKEIELIGTTIQDDLEEEGNLILDEFEKAIA